jgi:hypothetical protein
MFSLETPWVNYVLPGGKSDPFFEVRKGRTKAEKDAGFLSLSMDVVMHGHENTQSMVYSGTKDPKTLLAKSNVVPKCLDPEWDEVKIDW